MSRVDLAKAPAGLRGWNNSKRSRMSCGRSWTYTGCPPFTSSLSSCTSAICSAFHGIEYVDFAKLVLHSLGHFSGNSACSGGLISTIAFAPPHVPRHASDVLWLFRVMPPYPQPSLFGVHHDPPNGLPERLVDFGSVCAAVQDAFTAFSRSLTLAAVSEPPPN